MTAALALPLPPGFSAPSLVVLAARCWRSACDSGRPVQVALFETLDSYRCGMLAPVFASLMALYETCAGHRIRTGGSAETALSNDEHRLVGLLDGSADGGTLVLDAEANPALAQAMAVALRSTRIMMRLALEPIGAVRRRKARRVEG